MTAHSDVVIALLGASAGLAGLVLVFLGLVVAGYAALPGDSPAETKEPYRTTGSVLVVAFVVGLGTVGASTAWLLRLGDNHALYILTVALFVLQLVALVFGTFWTLAELLWD